MKKRISVGVILMMLILMLIPVQVFAANSIKLNKSAVSVYKNTSEKLKAKVVGKKKTVKWTTSDKSIATVKNGKVTGKKRLRDGIRSFLPFGVESLILH